MRAAIREAAPQAEETMSYGMPAFRQNGVLAYFAAHKDHIGFYPTPSGMASFEEDLAPFERSKGAVRFPLGRPLPLDIVKKMIRFRVKEDEACRRHWKHRSGLSLQ